jgi:hypothetical protein
LIQKIKKTNEEETSGSDEDEQQIKKANKIYPLKDNT